jgi:hypothetical protein
MIPPNIVDIVRIIILFTLIIIDELFIIDFHGIIPVQFFVSINSSQERSPLVQHGGPPSPHQATRGHWVGAM